MTYIPLRERLERLRQEAAEAGDDETVDACDVVLSPDSLHKARKLAFSLILEGGFSL